MKCKLCPHEMTNANTSVMSTSVGLCQTCHTQMINTRGWETATKELAGMKPVTAFSMKPKPKDIHEGLTGMKQGGLSHTVQIKQDEHGKLSAKRIPDELSSISHVRIEKVKNAGACTYCRKGVLSKGGADLDYPYDEVIEITGNRSTSRLCPDCASKIASCVQLL